jgi:hypothetical protein
MPRQTKTTGIGDRRRDPSTKAAPIVTLSSTSSSLFLLVVPMGLFTGYCREMSAIAIQVVMYFLGFFGPRAPTRKREAASARSNRPV